MSNIDKLHELMPNTSMINYGRENQFLLVVNLNESQLVNQYHIAPALDSIKWLVVSVYESGFYITSTPETIDKYNTRDLNCLKRLSNQSTCDTSAVLNSVFKIATSVSNPDPKQISKILYNFSTKTISANFNAVETIVKKFKEDTNLVLQEQNPILAKFGVMSEILPFIFDEIPEPTISVNEKDKDVTIANAFHDIFTYWNDTPYFKFIKKIFVKHNSDSIIDESIGLYNRKKDISDNAVKMYYESFLAKSKNSWDNRCKYIKYNVSYCLSYNDRPFNISVTKLVTDTAIYVMSFSHDMGIDSSLGLSKQYECYNYCKENFSNTIFKDLHSGNMITTMIEDNFFGSIFSTDIEFIYEELKNILSIVTGIERI